MIRRIALLVALSLVALPSMAATLFVTEFIGAPPQSVYYQAVNMPAVTTQTVAIGGSSVRSSAFNVNTGIVRVHADAACHIVIDSGTPTATSSSMRMAAGQTEYFVVKPGQLVAVITD